MSCNQVERLNVYISLYVFPLSCFHFLSGFMFYVSFNFHSELLVVSSASKLTSLPSVEL